MVYLATKYVIVNKICILLWSLYMNKSQKKGRFLILVLIDILLILVLIALLIVLPAIHKDRLSAVFENDTGDFPPETSPVTESQINEPTEIDYYANLPKVPYPSYLEMCELDYVAPPVARNREQAIETIKQIAYAYPAMWLVLENEEKYSDELIIALAANPEMTDYVYGYLFSDQAVTGGITDDESPDEYPLFLQWDIRWGYYPYGINTMGTSGCGPCCLSMAVYYLTGDKTATPNAVADYSLAHNYYVYDVGTSWALLDTYPKTFGLCVSHPSLSEANLKAELDKGNILICSVRPGNFTYSGHFIVIYDYDENGFKVNDPKCVYRSRQTWTYEQIKNDIKRTWSIGW